MTTSKRIQNRRAARQKQERRQRIIIISLLALAGAIWGGFALYDYITRPKPQTLSAERIATDPFKGAADAPVVIEEFSEAEGNPAKITFYFKSDSVIVAVKVSVGHETWYNEFSYYFNEKKNLVKYLKKTEGRPDNPEKKSHYL